MLTRYAVTWRLPRTPYGSPPSSSGLNTAPPNSAMCAVLDWSKEHEPTLAIRLAGASFELFNGLALLHESRRRSDLLYSLLPSLSAPLEGEARFLRMRSLHMRDVSLDAQLDLATQSAALYRKQGDARGLYEALAAVIQCFQTFPTVANAAWDEMAGLVDESWPPALRALIWISRSKIARIGNRLSEKRGALEAALPLVVQSGADRLTMVVLANLADHVLLTVEIDEAVQRGLELTSLLRRRRRHAQLPLALANLANALLQQGNAARARQALTEAFAEMRALQWNWLRGVGDVYALLAAREGRVTNAARLLGWADSVRKQRGERQPNEARCRALAMQDVAAALEGREIARLMSFDVDMDAESVHDLTLCSS